MIQKTYKINSVEETWAAAAEVAELLQPGTVMALHGDLGAGKTTFMQGVAMALGVDLPVTSPTFTLSNEYETPDFKLIHMDLYRLICADDLQDIGFLENLENGAVVALEWPERAEELIPSDAFHVYLDIGEGIEERVITIARES